MLSFIAIARETCSKFWFNIPLRIIRELNIKQGDCLSVTVSLNELEIELFRMIAEKSKSRKNIQVKVNVPKSFIAKAKIMKNSRVDVSAFKIENKRANILLSEGNFDFLSLIPKSFGSSPVIVNSFLKEGAEFCKVWIPPISGKTKPIIIKRFMPASRIFGELFGLMQAESRKRGYKFDFINKFKSEVKLFVETAESLGIGSTDWKYALHYSPSLDQKAIEEYLVEFSDFMNTNPQGISRILNKTIQNVVYVCCIDSKVLNAIMNSALVRIRNYLASCPESSVKQLADFAAGFIIKDLLGDGTVIFNKNSRALQVVISESDCTAQKEIQQILYLFFSIRSNIYKIRIYISTSKDSVLWLVSNSAFKEHSQNFRKLITYVLANKNFQKHYKKLLLINSTSLSDFRRASNTSLSTASMFLYRNLKKGLLQKKENKYYLSEKSKGFIELIQEVNKLPFHD